MRISAILLGATLQALHAAALPVAASDSPFTATSPTLASPSPSVSAYDWSAGYVSEFTIHQSCNATERREIAAGLEQTVLLAKHAKEHILIHRNTSQIFQKYFGVGPTAPVVGWLDKIASANRAGIVFRCDDPDQNCATQDGWAGHHRGSNATAETVICPLSYTTRLALPALCARGFDMATGNINRYWAADLMHRLWHVPVVSEDQVHHYADGYENLLELAKGVNYTEAARNSASLSYFALEAYAYDVVIPGEGCVGKVVEGQAGDAHGAAATTTEAVSAATATATAAVGQECHTHADGTQHCS